VGHDLQLAERVAWQQPLLVTQRQPAEGAVCFRKCKNSPQL
jgi:hypothetical protein